MSIISNQQITDAEKVFTGNQSYSEHAIKEMFDTAPKNLIDELKSLGVYDSELKDFCQRVNEVATYMQSIGTPEPKAFEHALSALSTASK